MIKKGILKYLSISAVISILAVIAFTPPAEAEENVNEENVNLDLQPYKENYVLPLTWGTSQPERNEKEFKFQFSVKQQLGSSDLYFGYTQKSFWQIYDAGDSRPFRESNYNPELFWDKCLDKEENENHQFCGVFGFIEHESNGSSTSTSRSWNRTYIRPYYLWNNDTDSQRLRVDLKLWARWQEESKLDPSDPAGDDNPDIHDYYGISELKVKYICEEKYELMLFGRWNPKTNKGAFEANLSTPIPFYDKDNVHLLFHYWTGYGESLIDYNKDLTRYGIGITFGQLRIN